MSITNVPELFGSMVFNDTCDERTSSQGRLQEAEEDHARGAPRSTPMLRCCCNGNEGLGDQQGVQPITRTGSSR